jgi:outer membrane protein
MRRSATRSRKTASLLVAAAAVLTAGARAQQRPHPAPPPAPAPAPMPATPQAPPPPPLQVAAPSAAEASLQPLSLVDAVQTALRIHPGIQAARADLAARRADIGLARGPFDPVGTASVTHDHSYAILGPSARVPASQSAILTDTTDFTLGAAAATHWGMSILPTVGWSRIHARPAGGSIPGVTDPYSQAHVGITLVQHLLRGAGTVGAASAIESTTRSARAAEHTVAFAAQQQAFAAAAAYFQLVAARDQLALQRDAEAGVRKVVEETRVLVASDQRPRADLHQLEGYLSSRTNAVIGAQNSYVQAAYALRAAMGLSADTAPLWQPTDSFPDRHPIATPRDALLRIAKDRRSDVSAAHELVASTAASLRGAEWNTHPALDLSASTGYVGVSDKDGAGHFFGAIGQNVPGVNAGVGLSLELPFNNTAQLAARDSQRAQYDRARIAAADVERTLPIDTLSAIEDVELSAAALDAATRAAQSLGDALHDEQDKMKSGVGTVIDMLFTQDRLIGAELTRTQNHLDYSLALTRLVFETGGMPRDPAAASQLLAELAAPGTTHGSQPTQPAQ